MQQLVSLWRALSPARRAAAIGVTVAVFGAVLLIARMAAQPSMALLYAGLEDGAAGEVVRALEARGVPFEIRNGSIMVAAAERDQLRMTLAAEGLPANSARGYELLDSLSGFGTTSQMFDAAYWRAKEGELARTILAGAGVSAARVHIANTGTNPFQRDVRPTASVAVTTTAGTLPPEQARAIRYLVASAVPGMAPRDVAVIDGNGGLVPQGDGDSGPGARGEERAVLLRERVLSLVEARVGRGNAVVEVSVETVTEQERIRERRVDPDSRVAISTDTEESSTRSEDTGTGVSVASNLPDGDAAGDERSTSENSETRERVNFEVSETEREILRAPGDIRRLTVAVLVGGMPTTAGEPGFRPMPEEELDALQDLVAAAVGFDEARGDTITIRSLQLADAPMPQAVEASRDWVATLGLDAMRIIQLAVLALVALILGLFVLRPMLTRTSEPAGPGLLASPEPAAPEAGTAPAPLQGEIEDGPFELPDLPAIGDAALSGEAVGESSPVDRLRGLIDERREETMEILSRWLEDEREDA